MSTIYALWCVLDVLILSNLSSAEYPLSTNLLLVASHFIKWLSVNKLLSLRVATGEPSPSLNVNLSSEPIEPSPNFMLSSTTSYIIPYVWVSFLLIANPDKSNKSTLFALVTITLSCTFNVSVSLVIIVPLTLKFPWTPTFPVNIPPDLSILVSNACFVASDIGLFLSDVLSTLDKPIWVLVTLWGFS